MSCQKIHFIAIKHNISQHMTVLMHNFIFSPFLLSTKPELQIRRGKWVNLGIIFHIPPLKRMLIDLSLGPSGQDGSNEGSQHIFSLRNKEN